MQRLRRRISPSGVTWDQAPCSSAVSSNNAPVMPNNGHRAVSTKGSDGRGQSHNVSCVRRRLLLMWNPGPPSTAKYGCSGGQLWRQHVIESFRSASVRELDAEPQHGRGRPFVDRGHSRFECLSWRCVFSLRSDVHVDCQALCVGPCLLDDDPRLFGLIHRGRNRTHPQRFLSFGRPDPRWSAYSPRRHGHPPNVARTSSRWRRCSPSPHNTQNAVMLLVARAAA